MTTYSRRSLLPLFVTAALVLTAAASEAQQTFTLTVPFRGGPRPQIQKVKIVFESAAIGANATVTIDGQDTACVGGPPCNVLGNFGPGNVDESQLKATATTLELTLDFKSDFVGGNYCNSTRVNPRLVSLVVSNAVNATGYRMASYTVPELTNAVPPGPPQPRCDSAFRRVTAENASLSALAGVTNLGRLPLDVILVLDKSGSMGWSLPGGPGDRWTRLQDAVGQFMNLYKQAMVVLSDQSTVEGSNADRVGLVLFDSTPQNANLGGGSIFRRRDAGWDDLDPAIGNIITAQLVPPPPQAAPGGATTIGGGITRAFDCYKFTDCVGVLAPNPQDAVIILFTDGEQNTPPCILSGAEANVSPCTTTRTPPLKLSGTDLFNRSIPIMTIGLGNVGESANLLDQISHETAGHSVIPVTGLALDIAFGDTLVKALKGNTLSLLNRQSEQLPTTGTGTTLTTPVDNSIRRVIWVLGWEGVRRPGALVLTIRAPNGTVVTPVVTGGGPAYFVASVDIPGTGPAGAWQAQVSRPIIEEPVPDGEGGPAVQQSTFLYHLSAYAVEGRLDYRLSVRSGEIGTGEPVTVRAELAFDTKPLDQLKAGAIRVTVERPGENLGNILSLTPATGTAQTEPGNSQSPTGVKFDALASSQNLVDRIEPKPLPTTVAMSDRGGGVYEATFSETVVGGKYGFRVEMNWDDVRTGPIKRTERVERDVPVIPTPEATQVQLNWNGTSPTAEIQIIPKGPFGLFVGPGHDNQFIVDVAPPAGKGVVVNPGVDGTYVIPITGLTPGANPNVRIRYGRFTLRDAPLRSIEQAGGERLSIGIRAGLAVPHGTFGSTWDPGFSLEADVEYAARPRLGIQGVAGYNTFGGTSGNLDLGFVSVRAKFYTPAANPRIAAFVGIGGYFLGPGGGHFGVNAGGVAEWAVTPKWGFEATYTFHSVATPTNASQFSTFQGGLRFHF